MFKSIRSFVVLLMALVFIGQVHSSGYTAATNSTLQKQFGFTVTETQSLSTVYNVVKLFITAPMNYYCGKGNIPWHIRWQIIVLAVAHFLYGLPGLLSSLESTDEIFPVCPVNTTDIFSGGEVAVGRNCDKDEVERTLDPIFFVFALSQFLAAIGSSIMFNCGVAHINANANPSYGKHL